MLFKKQERKNKPLGKVKFDGDGVDKSHLG